MAIRLLILSMILSQSAFADMFLANPNKTPYQVLEQAYNQAQNMTENDLEAWKNISLAGVLLPSYSSIEDAYNSIEIKIVDVTVLRKIPSTSGTPAVPANGPLFPEKPAVPPSPSYDIVVGVLKNYTGDFPEKMYIEDLRTRMVAPTPYCDIPEKVIFTSRNLLQGAPTYTVTEDFRVYIPYCNSMIDKNFLKFYYKTEYRKTNDYLAVKKTVYYSGKINSIVYGYIWKN